MGKQIKISVVTPSIRPRGLVVVQQSLERQDFADFEWLVEIGQPKRTHDLSAAMNRMIKRARGELIVSYQDFIWIPSNALNIVWELYLGSPKTFWTFAVAKTMDWKKVDYDWRGWGSMRRIKPWEWEADFASMPRRALFDVGGYDETYDSGWSWENCEVAVRAQKMGYEFMVYPELRVKAYNHDKVLEHPFRGKGENGDKFEITRNMSEFRLNYLD